jgi:hypothetical protein
MHACARHTRLTRGGTTRHAAAPLRLAAHLFGSTMFGLFLNFLMNEKM